MILIWHKLRHTDYTVTELSGGAKHVETIRADGGFWKDDTFVPWHCITWIVYKDKEPSKE